MKFFWVKKITLTDGVILLGLILMVIGLGMKIKEAKTVTEENRYVSVERKAEAMIVSVNINTATAVELESLPAIGPLTAQKIIEYRNSRGAYQKIEDIMNVSGIGEKTYEKIKENIRI